MSQACDRCDAPCGSTQRLSCNGYDGKRFCSRCWRKVGERKYLQKREREGWRVTYLPDGTRQLFAP